MELNYSSDIDIIYIYESDGETLGSESTVTNREFFDKLSRRITRTLTEPSEIGHLYRVDLRLRPGGTQGNLSTSLPSLVSYYKSWAELWEKQAAIKARFSAGDPALGRRAVKELHTIAYRENEPTFVIDEIRRIKDEIDTKISRKGETHSNVKLGRGGIRELEFSIQALQLVHGGADRWLRSTSTLMALLRLHDKGLISAVSYSELYHAYLFLRRVEHLLQIDRNLQTHLLPADEGELRVVAGGTGFLDDEESRGTDKFLERLGEVRDGIRSFYASILSETSQTALVESAGRGEEEPIFHREDLSEDTKLILKRIKGLFPSEERASPSTSAFSMIEKSLAGVKNINRTLRKLESFLISLSSEKGEWDVPSKLRETHQPLLQLFAKSEFLSNILIRRPSLLFSVENPWLKKKEADYEPKLVVGEEATLGEAMSRLRRVKDHLTFAIGFHDLAVPGHLFAANVSLSKLADSIVKTALERIARQYEGEAWRPDSLTIISLGRLGTKKIGYDSDLDLLFVHSDPEGSPAVHEFFQKMARETVNFLTTITQDGFLYRVDCRLRPRGKEGELSNRYERFLEYFREGAEVWEKSSFLKARFIAGDHELAGRLIRETESEIFRSFRFDAYASMLRLG